MTKRQAHGDHFDDDDDSFLLVDFEENRLRFHTGPVYGGNTPHPEPGIWISFSGWDDEHIVISPATFRALAAHIERRLLIRWGEATGGTEGDAEP